MGLAKVSSKSKLKMVRMYDGKIVKPILYNGKAIGHPKLIAASMDDQLVVDDKGFPVAFKNCGSLVKIS